MYKKTCDFNITEQAVMKDAKQESGYQKRSKKVVSLSVVFIAGMVILSAAFIVGINILESCSLVFWISGVSVIAWGIIFYFILQHMVNAEKKMREEARTSDLPEITNPLFKEILNGYRYNRLEEFTKNIFFRTWKLQDSGDYNNAIDLIFTRGQREIAIDISNDEVSIIIDEETDDPIEIVLDMDDFDSAEDVLNRISRECWSAVKQKK